MAVSAAPVATTAIRAAFTNFIMDLGYRRLVGDVTPATGWVFGPDCVACGTKISASGNFATDF